MFSEKEKRLLSVNRAVIDLHGFFIITENNDIIDNPRVLVELLAEKELEAYDKFRLRNMYDKALVEETILDTKVICILDYEDEEISQEYSPAGIINHIAESIIKKSQEYIKTPTESYARTSMGVTFLETMISIISYYTNTPYDVVSGYPINQIFKRYAVCQSAFPNQIEPLTEEELAGA